MAAGARRVIRPAMITGKGARGSQGGAGLVRVGLPCFRLGGVWKNRDFIKLWTSETVSLFGSQVTTLALPLTAIQFFAATPAQMGILSAARFLPFLLLTLFAGVWVDVYRRRPIMMGANLGRALVLALVPAGAAMGWLRMSHLYGVALAVGALTVLFDLAYQSYVPTLVEREELVEANSMLQASASAAEVGGPALGGLLVEWLTAPVAVAADALSFVMSAVLLGAIRRPEARIEPTERRLSLFHQIGEGLRTAFRNPYLRSLAGEAATYNFFETAILALFALYGTQELGLSPAQLGTVMGTGAVGTLAGALMAERVARVLGLGRAILASMTLACVAPLLIPLVRGPLHVVIGLLVVAFFVNGAGLAMSNVHVVSLRQAVTPPRLLGRMNASYRFFVYGAIPLGSLFGGLLGEHLGVRSTLFVAAGGLCAALLWVVLSPVPRLRRLPEQAGAGSG